jgi:hypothetical protein
MDAEEDRYNFFRQADYEAHRDFDKAIMSLSAGALGVSIAFIHNIAPDPRLAFFLRIAWVAFAVSLILILISFQTSKRALRHEMTTSAETPGAEGTGGRFGKLTKMANSASATAFGLGVVALTIFALSNV